MNVVFCDIDGCLVPINGMSPDLNELQNVCNLINDLKRERTYFSLCTGRSAPYAELMSSILKVNQLSIIENGAYIYNPVTKKSIINPRIKTQDIKKMQSLKLKLMLESEGSGDFMVEGGKDMSISLNPLKGDIYDLFLYVEEQYADGFNVTHSSTAVDVTTQGVDKGVCLDIVKKILKTNKTFGIGDSFGDICFLNKVDHSSSPYNASDDVKKTVSYISDREYAKGVSDIIQNFIKA